MDKTTGEKILDVGMHLGYLPIILTEKSKHKAVRLSGWLILFTLWLPVLCLGVFIAVTGIVIIAIENV